MSNLFYTPTGNPAPGAEGLSALMRREFAAISAGFDLLPAITTTGPFATVFNQVGNYTFTLPAYPGTLACLSDVATETTARTAADAAEAAARNNAISVETTARTAADAAEAAARTAADAAEATARNNAISVETTARTAADAAEVTARNTAIAVETARATAAETAAYSAGGIGRNRLHNGGFGINQRSYGSGTALSAGVYAHDRWKAGADGGAYTFSQAQPTTVITITAGTLQQVVEALSVEGGAYTLSWIGTAMARINSGSYLASPISVTGLAANTAITVEFSTGTVDRAQLEPGSAATVFTRRSYRYELAECQRFYQTGRTLMNGYAAAGNLVGQTHSFPVMMRATPSFTYGGNSGYAIGSHTLTAVSNIAVAVGGTVLANGAWSINDGWSASADL